MTDKQTILIAGATGNIGSGAALALAKRGARVVLLGHRHERTKTMNRMIAAELARRYAGKISSVAFNSTFIIDKSDPELDKRWPTGFMGLFWRLMTVLLARPPAVAGEPIADLMLSYRDRSAINGALFKLDRRVEKPDRTMNDQVLGKRLWDELVRRIGETAE